MIRIIEEIRAEIIGAFVIFYIGILYYGARRVWSELHRTFSVTMQVALINLVFEALTIQGLNDPRLFPDIAENIFFRIYLVSMMATVYMCYMHTKFLLSGNRLRHNPSGFLAQLVIAAVIIATPFVPMNIEVRRINRFLSGWLPHITYTVSAFFIVVFCIRLIIYWNKIDRRTRTTICLSAVVLTLGLITQLIIPTAYVTGLSFTLVIFAFYITIENPDLILIRLLKVEKQKAEAANASKSKFVAAVSSDIKNPADTIAGMADLLLKGNPDEEQKKYLSLIRSSAKSLVVAVNDILDQSKLDTGKIEIVEKPYKLYDQLDEIRMIIENRIGEKPVKFVCDIDNRTPEYVMGDSLRLLQILVNIIGNSLKNMNEGTIVLRLRLVSARKYGYSIKFSVSDTGNGIRQKDLSALLADPESNVIGPELSISAELVSAMGGRLEFRSELGKGSEFYFTLFQKRVDGNNLYDMDEKEMYRDVRGLDVLIIDDTELDIEAGKEILQTLGVHADTADSGASALRMLDEKEYDMILTVYEMLGMSGTEFTRNLRSRDGEYFKRVPIIAIIGDNSENIMNELCISGVTDYIDKPIDVKKILRVISKWMDRIKH